MFYTAVISKETNMNILFISFGLLLTSVAAKKQFRRSYIGYEIDNEIDYDVEGE